MTTNTLEKRAFKALLFEKFPAINKNCIELFMENRKLFTIKELGYEILEFISCEV